MSNFKHKMLEAMASIQDTQTYRLVFREEYLKLFKKMATVDKGVHDFRNAPIDFFENFDYEIYDKDYVNDSSIDFEQLRSQYSRDANLIVLLNGCFSVENSIINSDKIIVMSLSEKLKNEGFLTNKYFLNYYERHENQLTVLNSILSNGGLYLHIPANTTVKDPIFILNIITEQDRNYFFNYRNLIIADENSNAKIIESDLFLSKYKSLILKVSFNKQYKNSHIDYNCINSDRNLNQHNDGQVSFITENGFFLEESATLNHNNIIFDTYYTKNTSHFVLEGNSSDVDTSVFSFLKSDSIVDIQTQIEHVSSNTGCRQLVKSIVDDNGYFTFDGKILVDQDAQKIKAMQNSRAILISDNARAELQPQLEIYADDVICTHGATVGSLDTDLLFYLNSRGISNEQAKKLLLIAFASEVVDKMSHNYTHNWVTENLYSKI